MPLSARKLIKGEWHGKNYLGIILAECRLEIRSEYNLRAQQGNVSANLNKSPPMRSQLPPAQVAHASSQQHAIMKPAGSKRPVNQYGSANNTIQTQSNQIGYQPNAQPSLPQQQSQWPPQMMFPSQGFPYPPPTMPNYYMYPPMSAMQTQMPQAQLDQNQFLPRPPIPTYPAYNYMSSPSRHNSPSVSDYSNHGDRRLSYDPELSPVILV